MLLFVLPLQMWVAYTPLFEQLKLESAAVRQQWEAILAADPPADAILVSNDRNEIVPLFYLQTVEGRAPGMTGLFPLIAPDARFADIGATLQSALDAGGTQPVMLIKPMPGLEARFELAERPPLVEVIGAAGAVPPAHPVNARYGPLELAGYTWTPAGDGIEVVLTWRVVEPLPADFTTTVQLFDAGGARLGQDDRAPGGVYYPTSHWKPGETLVDAHTIALPPDAAAVRMLVGMYAGPEAQVIAPPLEIEINP